MVSKNIISEIERERERVGELGKFVDSKLNFLSERED